MDEYNEDGVANKAHQIIYKSLYGKFKDLKDKKQIFNEESDKVYKDAIEHYSWILCRSIILNGNNYKIRKS